MCTRHTFADTPISGGKYTGTSSNRRPGSPLGDQAVCSAMLRATQSFELSVLFAAPTRGGPTATSPPTHPIRLHYTPRKRTRQARLENFLVSAPEGICPVGFRLPAPGKLAKMAKPGGGITVGCIRRTERSRGKKSELVLRRTWNDGYPGGMATRLCVAMSCEMAHGHPTSGDHATPQLTSDGALVKGVTSWASPQRCFPKSLPWAEGSLGPDLGSLENGAFA